MTEQEMNTRVEAIRNRLGNTLTPQEKEEIKKMDERMAERMSKDSCGWVHQKNSQVKEE